MITALNTGSIWQLKGRWNRASFYAGCLADVADTLACEVPRYWINKFAWWDVAVEIRKVVLTGRIARFLSVHAFTEAKLTRQIGDQIPETDLELASSDWIALLQRKLVRGAFRTLVACAAAPFENTDEYASYVVSDVWRVGEEPLRHAFEAIELQWRIRDWLDTVAPKLDDNVRHAAEAAWEAGHRSVAREIVLAKATPAVDGGDGA